MNPVGGNTRKQKSIRQWIPNMRSTLSLSLLSPIAILFKPVAKATPAVIMAIINKMVSISVLVLVKAGLKISKITNQKMLPYENSFF
jgi:hypothetical protein